MSCSLSVNFEVYEINGVKQITNDGAVLTVMLQNNGRTKIENFSITIITEEGVFQETLAQELPVGTIKRYTHPHGLGNDLTNIRIAPRIKQGGTFVECTNIFVETDQFRTITETIGLDQHTLTVNINGNGTVISIPGTINCPGTCSDDFNENTEVTLTAEAGEDYEFTGWSGACSGEQPTCVVNMTEAKTVTAEFNEEWQMPYQSDLVGYWRFENNFEDSSQNNNHGAGHGGTTFVLGERVSSSYVLKLDGTNGYVRIPHSNTLNLNTNLTISFWVKTTNHYNNWNHQQFIIKGICTQRNYDMAVRSTGLANYHYMVQGGTRFRAESTTIVDDGEWYFLTATFGGSQGKIYVNGILEDTVTWTGSLQTNSYDLIMGTSFNAGGGNCYGHHMDGYLDEVAIWNRTLTAQEIQQIYDNTK